MISTCGSLRTSFNENDIKVATPRKVRTFNDMLASWLLLQCADVSKMLKVPMYYVQTGT